MYLGYIDTYGGTNYVPTIVMHIKDLLLLSIRLGTIVFVKGRVFESDAIRYCEYKSLAHHNDVLLSKSLFFKMWPINPLRSLITTLEAYCRQISIHYGTTVVIDYHNLQLTCTLQSWSVNKIGHWGSYDYKNLWINRLLRSLFSYSYRDLLFFLKNGPSPPSFSLYLSFQNTVDS